MALEARGYEVVRIVGKGAFGQAMLVRHQSSSIAFCAKEIDMTNMSKRDIDGSRNEVAVLNQLDHPNITKFIESFEHANRIYIVMEFADGGDLAQRIKKQKRELRKPFTEEQVLIFFIQVCLALKHLHKKQILHRDLKTMNVFLTSSDVVKLGDFGVSKQLGTVGVAQTVCGTPYYFSPEMCRNEAYSSKCDVWSLGVMLYELIMLTKPFQAKDIKSLMQVIVTGVYQPMSDKLGHSEELREMCRTLLNLNPQQRPNVSQVMASPYMQRSLKNFASAIREKEAQQQRAASADPQRPAPKAAAPPTAAAPPASGGGAMKMGKMKKGDMAAMMAAPPPGYEQELKNQPSPARHADAGGSGSPRQLQEHERLEDVGCRQNFEKTVADCAALAQMVDGPQDENHGAYDFGDQGGQPQGPSPAELRDLLLKHVGDGALRQCYDVYASFDAQGGDEAALLGRLQQILGKEKMQYLPQIEQYIFRDK